jgi:hypothetical protein
MEKPTRKASITRKVQEKRRGNESPSSDDEKNMLMDDDNGFQSRDYSSGAKVKGDSDYYP